MRLVRFDDDRLGIVDGDQLIDISNLVDSHPDSGRLHAFIRSARHGRSLNLSLLADAPRLSMTAVTLACPLPLPPKVIAAPVNYLNHKEEMRVEHTIADLGIFLKARTSVVGDGGTVVLPYSDQRFDQEGELGVVIGQQVHNIAPERAMEAVFGYTCLLDMSMRSTEDRSTRKSFDTFTPVGPWVVTADEVGDPGTLQMRCWVNDDLRQDTSTADLIFDVPTLVAYASSVMTLEPGDVVATGTPAGVGPVVDGDTITVEISKVGRLQVSVSAAGAIAYDQRIGADLNPSLLSART